METEINSKAGTIIDLFSGCGGFSLGAEMAGFRSLAAIDIDPVLQSAYRRNFPRTRVVQASVSEIEESNWRRFLGRRRPDGIIGGPPCQGFSLIGKRKKDDPRNELIGQFFRHIKILQPKFFIMENVEGILSADSADFLKEAVETVSSKYIILDPLIVRASDFGAATSRRRVIVVGYDRDEMNPLLPDDLRQTWFGPTATVRDAISDLPSPQNEVGNDEFQWTNYPLKRPDLLSNYARLLRRQAPEELGWDQAKEKHLEGYVSGLAITKHSTVVSERYASIEGGKCDPITKSHRLRWDGLCPTLRAGTGSDKGAFQAVRPLHPSEGRVITVREAARLQGFPDWFVFHPTKWHSFRMLGNSVSPMVSYGLTKTIAQKMLLSLAA